MSVELQGSCPFYLDLLCWQLLIIMSTFSISFFVINTTRQDSNPKKKKFIFIFLRMSGCVYGYNSRSVKQLKSNAFSIDPPVLCWIGIWLMYFFLGHWFDDKRLIQRNKVVLNILWFVINNSLWLEHELIQHELKNLKRNVMFTIFLQ